MPTIAAPPSNDSLIELDETRRDRKEPFYISRAWLLWLQDAVVSRVQQAPTLVTGVTLTGQTAAISATPIPLASVAAGRFRLSYYARITTPDGVSSSLTVTLGWVESAVTLTSSGTAMTGDSVTTVQSGTIVVQADANSALVYSTAYASNTAAAMTYRLSIVCEALS